MSVLAEWRERRVLRHRANAYVAHLFREPLDSEVRWLAEHGTGGDSDHARWELRYARRAMGLLTAQRDALDDRTASVVARALGAALGRDRNVAPGKLKVVERQLNSRLRAYGDALSRREGAGSGWHLGRTLLEFAGRKESVEPQIVARAGDLMATLLGDANAALREQFGVASLPEDLPPSVARVR